MAAAGVHRTTSRTGGWPSSSDVIVNATLDSAPLSVRALSVNEPSGSGTLRDYGPVQTWSPSR